MFDVYEIKEDALLVGRPKGKLDARLGEEVCAFIEIKEALWETGFNRFCDLSQVDAIQISLAEIEELASRRRTFNPNLVPVKSAFLAKSSLAVAIACLYGALLKSPRIRVSVFSTLAEAACWLKVDPAKLQL